MNADPASPPGRLLRARFVQNLLPALASLALHGVFAVAALSSARVAFRPAPPCPEAQTDFDCRAGVPLLGTAGDGDVASIDVPPSAVPGGAAGVPAVDFEHPDSPGGSDAVPRIGLAPSDTADWGVAPGRPAASPRGSGSMFDLPGAANARSICYVCDPSGSMLSKMATLKFELGKAVSALTPGQSFNIICSEGEPPVAVDRSEMLPATDRNKARAEAYLDNVTTSGPADIIAGLRLAFRLRPEVIYVVTDGDFPDNKAVLAEVARLNREGRVRINTIAFVSDVDQDVEFLDVLAKIAAENGGAFRRVKESDLN